MSVRTRDWLKFIGLVGLAFVFGLGFASALDLPRKTSAEPAVLLQAAAQRPVIPAAKPAADLGDAFVAVAEQVKPAVVYIVSEIRQHADSAACLRGSRISSRSSGIDPRSSKGRDPGSSCRRTDSSSPTITSSPAPTG